MGKCKCVSDKNVGVKTCLASQDLIIKRTEKPMAVSWRSEPVDFVVRYFYVKTTALPFSAHRYGREVPPVALGL